MGDFWQFDIFGGGCSGSFILRVASRIRMSFEGCVNRFIDRMCPCSVGTATSSICIEENFSIVARGVRPLAYVLSLFFNVTDTQYARKEMKICASIRWSV